MITDLHFMHPQNPYKFNEGIILIIVYENIGHYF